MSADVPAQEELEKRPAAPSTLGPLGGREGEEHTARTSHRRVLSLLNLSEPLASLPQVSDWHIAGRIWRTSCVWPILRSIILNTCNCTVKMSLCPPGHHRATLLTAGTAHVALLGFTFCTSFLMRLPGGLDEPTPAVWVSVLCPFHR